jgi:hypothetical protein
LTQPNRCLLIDQRWYPDGSSGEPDGFRVMVNGQTVKVKTRPETRPDGTLYHPIQFDVPATLVLYRATCSVVTMQDFGCGLRPHVEEAGYGHLYQIWTNPPTSPWVTYPIDVALCAYLEAMRAFSPEDHRLFVELYPEALAS